MEAALRSVLKDTLGDYVQEGLEQADASSFPMELRDVQLNAKRVNHELRGGHGSAIELTSGTIGSVKVTPGWMGNIEVVATNIQLSFSFSPTKAIGSGMMQAMSRSEDAELSAAIAASMEEAQNILSAAPLEVTPRLQPMANPVPARGQCFCSEHDSSEKRTKVSPEVKECMRCRAKLMCSYTDFKYCPSCSGLEQKCVICGQQVTPSNATCISKEACLHPRRTSMASAPSVPSALKDCVQPHAFSFGQQPVCPESNGTSGAFFEAFFGALSNGSSFWPACTDDTRRSGSPWRYGGA